MFRSHSAPILPLQSAPMFPPQPPPILPTQGITRSVTFLGSSRLIVGQCPIGEGHFGKVYRGTLNEDIAVAVKMLKVTDTNSVMRFLNEARTMQTLVHPNVVKFYGVTELDGQNCIVSEYVDLGSLESMIKRPDVNLDVAHLTMIAEQIVLGMCHISEKHIVHRDLRTANVLVKSLLPIQVKVADFGLAKRGVLCPQGIEYVTRSPFAPIWTAPEARTLGVYTSQSDVYSFGCLMLEMITKGRWPFAGIGTIPTSFPLSDPTFQQHPYYILMKSCFSIDPQQRPLFSVLKGQFANILRPPQQETASVVSGQFPYLTASVSVVPNSAGVPGPAYPIPNYPFHHVNTYAQPIYGQFIADERSQSVPPFIS